jgi:hypothetical protein
MPTFLKHVGQVASTGKKCVVVFRTIPGEESSCLVVETEGLATNYHDNLVEAIESQSGQEDIDFYKYAQRSSFFDGRNMLEAMHTSGWLRKYSTNEIIMMPTPEIKIGLNELNVQLNQASAGRTTSGDISQQTTESKPAGVLDDKDIANQMRSQAAFFKSEAERLYKEAEAMDPQTTAQITATPASEVAEAPRVKRAYNRKK